MRGIRVRWASWIALVLTVLCATPLFARQGPLGLGNRTDDLNYFEPVPVASANGRSLVIPEYLEGVPGRPFVWRVDLENPVPLSTPGFASAVILSVGLSGDGRTIVGQVESYDYPYDRPAVAWRDGQFQLLGDLPQHDPDYAPIARAYAASHDGAVIVGSAAVTHWGSAEPTRWLADGSAQPIPIVDGVMDDGVMGEAQDVSADGRVIAGIYGGNIFIWNTDEGTRFLEVGIVDSSYQSKGIILSNDGATLAGVGRLDGTQRAFVWSAADGVTILYDAEREIGWNGRPLAISADGSTVVGTYEGFWGTTAFIWTRERGIEDLRTLLERVGVNTSEWYQLGTAWGISADGLTVFGTGHRTSEAETFVADLRVPTLGANLCTPADPDCIPIRVVAIDGQLPPVPPGSNAARRYGNMLPPQINEVGEVLVQNYLGQQGFYLVGPDDAGEPIVRVAPGDPALGVGDDDSATLQVSVHDNDFDAGSAMNDDGDIAFAAEIFGANIPAGTEHSLWVIRQGEDLAELVARSNTGNAPPDDVTFDHFCKFFQIDARGGVGFRGAHESNACAGRSSVLARSAPEDLEVLARTGHPAPAIGDPEVTFEGALLSYMNEAGDSAFRGSLSGPEVTEADDTAIWATGADGDLALVLREGDPAPGLPAGTVFSTHSGTAYRTSNRLALTGTGHLAFYSDLSGPTVGDDHLGSYWTWSPTDGLDLVLTMGERALGEESDATFSELSQPVMNSRGEIAFRARAGPPSDPNAEYGFWLRSRNGELIPLLRRGLQAPGLPAATLLGSPWYHNASGYERDTLDDPILNRLGNTLLDFELEGGGVDASNDRALYHVDRHGRPILVLRKGDRLEVAHGDVRTVSDYFLQTGIRSMVGRKAFNARGDVAVLVEFEDATRAVVVFEVPEPDLTIAVLIGALALSGLARSNRRTNRLRPTSS